MNRTLGVLISGRGSNLKAIIDAIDDRRARCLDRYRDLEPRRCARDSIMRSRQGSKRWCSSHKAYPSREDYDRALVAELRNRDVALVCLAGFMRLLSPVFVDAFPNRILNIHPSLLPKYPGLHPQQQALDDGATDSGATVHFVNKDLDAGRSCCSGGCRSFPGDTADTPRQPESLLLSISCIQTQSQGVCQS